MKKIPQLSDLMDEDETRSEAGASEGSSSGKPRDDRTPSAGASEPEPGTPAITRGGAGTADAPVTVAEADGGAPSPLAGKRAASPAAEPEPSSAPPRKASGAGKGSRSRARRYARERALQALYQWDLAAAESSDVRRQFIDRQDMSRVDVEYFERLFRGVSHDVDSVDVSLARALDRPIADLDPIERAVLRVAAFELAEVLETPARVVINEGVEITKRFGADNGHRYVNGVLDRLAGLIRPREMRRG